LAFEVAVEDLAIVDVLETEADLGEPLEDLILAEVTPPLFLYSILQIATYSWFISS